MQIISNIDELKRIRSEYKLSSVGFVPTMGALHDGHLSLIKRSKVDNDKTFVSIFVNPTQFNDKTDFDKYPKLPEQDIALLERENVDYLFLPNYSDIYNDDYRYKIIETKFSKQLCGASRPGHFDGVLTIVMKLFNIVNPTRAYFGEKDYQQYLLIRDMVKAFHMNIEIIPMPIVREKDGLAMSSRNLRLTKEERNLAPEFYKILKLNKSDQEISEMLTAKGFKVDYITTINNRRFGAVYLGNVRLIDNVEK